MPKWGMTMEEGTVLKWLKNEGDFVHKEEDLVEIEAAKITNIIQSSANGILFQIAVRSMMFLSLTFDHRVADGAMAGSFLETLGRYLENPVLLFV